MSSQLEVVFSSIPTEYHLLWKSVVVKEQGLLSQIEIDDRFDGKGVHPYSGGAGLEPRTFRIGLVDSFGNSLYKVSKNWLVGILHW